MCGQSLLRTYREYLPLKPCKSGLEKLHKNLKKIPLGVTILKDTSGDDFMVWFIIATVALLLSAAFYVLLRFCFVRCFYVKEKRILKEDEFETADGECYDPFREYMIEKMKETRALPRKDYSIKSFDGLTLWGSFYELYEKGPIELMFHGYRGTAERDLCGAVNRCRRLGHSAFIVDQRAATRSDGNVITFGVNESKDCLRWVDFVTNLFPERKIIITGISMGGATVLNAASSKLPKNVVGVIADCSYSSAKEIITKVINTDMHLPGKVFYPFVKLSAKLFGKFDLEEISPIESVKKFTLPVLFIHGEDDNFVPCEMSRRLYSACSSDKMLLTVPGADHGLSYLVDKDRYIKTFEEFERKYISE